MPKSRQMICPKCGWTIKVYGHGDPYYCPQCDDVGVKTELIEEN